jgi:ATP-dependent Lon protease
MRDFRDAKGMAQRLREALKQKSVSLTHSESLELIAKTLGFPDWNVLSARIHAEPNQTPIRIPANVPAVPLPAGADLPLVPLRDIVLFPNMIAPIFVGREKTKRALDCAMAADRRISAVTDRRIFAVTQRRADDDDPTQETLYAVGVVAHVIELLGPLAEVRIMVRGLKRMTLTRLVRGEMLAANVAPFADSGGDTAQGEMLARTILDRLQDYLNVNFASEPYSRLPHIREPGVLADVIAALMPIEIGQRQELLETGNATARLEKILALIKNGRRAA